MSRKQLELNEKNVKKALRKLGDSGKQIACSLSRRHIKGQRMHCESCPVARYLQKTFQCGFKVSENIETSSGYIKQPSSKAIKRFIDMFDEGKFPNLIERTV